jgi:tetratricopeptide (TPR) repeat protein
MVAVHETDVLKQTELDNLSPLRATDLYLASAKSQLVAAAERSREASDALVILARIEKAIENVSESHSAAVALTLQRAAVEIAPDNALAFRELGSSLLNQGLLEHAVAALNRSVQLEPSPDSYRLLLEASRRLGDADLARRCLLALRKNESSGPGVRVRQLAPQQFAATHLPANRPSRVATTNQANPQSAAAQSAAAQSAAAQSAAAQPAPPAKKTPLFSKARTWLTGGRY